MQEQEGKKKSKGLMIGLIVAALVLVGGSVSAFFIFSKSPKIQYLMAESESVKLMGDLFEDRYKNEMNWMETQNKKPVESQFDISAEWNDPYVDIYMEDVQSIVNSSALSVKNVYDPIKKENEIELGGKVGSTELTIGNLILTPEKLFLSLPFSEDIIRFDDKDFGKLMREIDEDYDGQEELGLSKIFESVFSTNEELNTYIQEEYLEYFIEELPEEAFTSEKEKIEVFDKKIDAKKLSMKLSEKEVKALMTEFFEKFRDDEKLMGILKESMLDQAALASSLGEDMSSEVDNVFDDMEGDLNEVIEEIDTWRFSDGIESTIWHHSNKVVKRDFAMSAGENEEETSFEISGTQLLEKTNQKWAYTVIVNDSYYDEENSLEFTGDLTWKDNKAKDSIKISVDDFEVFYEGEEKLNGKKRTFSREVGYSDGYSTPKLIWVGNATHEKDSIKASHEFTISGEGMEENMYNLIVNQEGKVVKKVDMPGESNKIVNIGDMKVDEIQEYVETDLAAQFQEWIDKLMGDLEKELYD